MDGALWDELDMFFHGNHAHPAVVECQEVKKAEGQECGMQR